MSDLFSMNTKEDVERIAPMIDALGELDIFTTFNSNSLEGSSQLEKQRQQARACLVFWSNSSYQNPSICDQVKLANEDNKFIHILLDNLRLSQLPEMVSPENIIRLSNWSGEQNDPEWKKLLSQVKKAIRPKWLQKEIELKNDDIEAEKQRTQAALANGKLIKVQLEKEIANHNSSRKRSAENHNHLSKRYEDNLSSLQQMQSEVALLQENLKQEKTKSSELSKQVATFTKRKYSLFSLIASSVTALLIGLASVYGLVTMPLQLNIKKTANELTKTRSAHASTLQTVKQLELKTKSEKLQKSKALSKLQLLETELAQRKMHYDKALEKRKAEYANALEKLSAEYQTVSKNLAISQKEHRKLKLRFNEQKHEVHSTSKALTLVRNELQETKNLYQETSENLNKKTQQLEQIEKQLKVTKEQSQQQLKDTIKSSQQLKKNAYREIANLKNNHKKEVAGLRRKIAQLKKSKAKPKAQNN